MEFTTQKNLLQGVVYSVFQRTALPSQSSGVVVAVVAAHDGAGTSSMTALLADSLASDGGKNPAILDCRELVKLRVGHPPHEIPAGRLSTKTGGASRELKEEKGWRNCRDFRMQYFARARESFGNVLVDCQSLKSSTDVLGIASLVDGIFLVVEANKTTKSQVAYLEKSIQAAGGHILGHLLNKRTYPIPEWIHSKMVRFGL